MAYGVYVSVGCGLAGSGASHGYDEDADDGAGVELDWYVDAVNWSTKPANATAPGAVIDPQKVIEAAQAAAEMLGGFAVVGQPDADGRTMVELRFPAKDAAGRETTPEEIRDAITSEFLSVGVDYSKAWPGAGNMLDRITARGGEIKEWSFPLWIVGADERVNNHREVVSQGEAGERERPERVEEARLRAEAQAQNEQMQAEIAARIRDRAAAKQTEAAELARAQAEEARAEAEARAAAQAAQAERERQEMAAQIADLQRQLAEARGQAAQAERERQEMAAALGALGIPETPPELARLRPEERAPALVRPAEGKPRKAPSRTKKTTAKPVRKAPSKPAKPVRKVATKASAKKSTKATKATSKPAKKTTAKPVRKTPKTSAKAPAKKTAKATKSAKATSKKPAKKTAKKARK